MKALLPLSLLALCAQSAHAVIDLGAASSNATYWTGIEYVNTSDNRDDAQTSNGGGEADLIGEDPSVPGSAGFFALYKGFDFGTVNPSGTTSADLDGDETIAFRARVGGDDNPSGFGTALWIGIDIGATGGFDYFIGIYDSNNDDDIGLYRFDTAGGATTIDDTKKAVYTQVAWNGTVANEDMSAGTGTSFFSRGDSVGDPTDLDGIGNPDYLVQLELDFSDLATAMGFTQEALFDTQIGFGLWTSQNLNQVNNDINGTAGNTDLTPSDPYTPSGTDPVPEPSTYALIFGFIALGFAASRRRK